MYENYLIYGRILGTGVYSSLTFIRRKQVNYDYYCELFEDFELGKMIPFREGTSSNKWFYSIEINRDRIQASMREIITALEERCVQTRAIWGLINEQIPYQHERTYKLEKAPYYAARILNIPCSTQITKEEMEYVAAQIKDVLRGFLQRKHQGRQAYGQNECRII